MLSKRTNRRRNRRKTHKRSISILLTLVLMLSMLSGSFPGVYADEAEEPVVLAGSGDDKVTALSVLVDKTLVQVGEPFTYTIYYSYSSNNVNFTGEQILLTLPEPLEYVSAAPSQHVSTIDTHAEPIVISMKDMDAGTTGFLKVTARFKAGSIEDTTSITSSVTNGAEDVIAHAPEVTATVNSDWTWSLSKARISPAASVIPAVGSDVTYQITVKGNHTAGGWNIQNVVLTDILPAGAVFVHASNSGVYNVDEHKVTWSIGELKAGETKTYTITINYPEGIFHEADSVTNEALLEGEKLSGETESLTAENTHLLEGPQPGIGSLSKTSRQGNDKYSPGQTLVFYIDGFDNSGNVPLNSMTLLDTIPDGMDLESVTGGGAHTVYYQTNDSEDWMVWDNPSTKPVSAPSYIKAVKWEYSSVPVGFSPERIEVKGTLLNTYRENILAGQTVDDGHTITNYVSLKAAYGETELNRNASATITIGDLEGKLPWLVVEKLADKSSVYEEETVGYTIRLRNHPFATGDLNMTGAQSIEIKDILPKDKGNSANDAFEDFIFNPIIAGTATGKGSITLTENGNEKTWELKDAHLKPGQYLDIKYSIKVKKGTYVGKYQNEVTLNPTAIPTDSRTANPLKATADLFVKFSGAMNAVKGIKGHTEPSFEFPGEGANPAQLTRQTLAGGSVRYQLKVSNEDSNGPITNLVVIDKLPYIGDKGVIVSTNRQSDWMPYLINEVTGANKAALPAGVKIFYSESSTPDTSKLYNPLGSDSGWSATPPADITKVKAIKFEFGSIVFQPKGAPMILEWDMRAPVGAPTDKIAWNSFAYGATYTELNSSGDEYQQPFLPAEPIKVGMSVIAQPNYVLGDYIWVDTNKNGLQDEGEQGFNGILVNLYKDGTLMDYTRTGFDHNGRAGYYLFPNLVAGDYTVEFELPDGYYITDAKAGSDDAKDSDFTLHSGQMYRETVSLTADNVNLDAGIYQKSSVGDYVWNDRNRNGVQDSGEPPIQGVTVTLYKSDGTTVVATTVTGADGKYLFENLDPGEYIIEFTRPSADFVFSDAGKGNANNNCDVNSQDGLNGRTPVFSLKSNEHRRDLDAGMYLGRLGDKVWHDLNANGIQDTGESGISGITVKLRDTNGNPVQDAFGKPVADTTTNSSGMYYFNDLKAGDYVIEFVKPSSFDKFSPANQGGDSTKDSNADSTIGKTGIITLAAGEQNLTIDAGMYKLASIGDYAWKDVNANGIQNLGEPGIPGVTVNLLNSAGDVLTTTTTDSNGKYLFDKLEPGIYQVQFINNHTDYLFSRPNQGNDGTDSDAVPNSNHTIGTTGNYTLSSGDSNLTVDAGLYEISSAIQIQKTVYAGHNGGIGTGSELVGGQENTLVTYLFAVTNTGNTYLKDISIVDALLNISKTDMTHKSGNAALLAPGETAIYYYETTISKNLVNTAVTEGTPCYDENGISLPGSDRPTDSDEAEVVLVIPGIELVKTVYKGHDGGQQVGEKHVAADVNSPITYVFTIQNTGERHLTNISIIDDDIKINKSHMTRKIGVEPLAPGETLVYYYETTLTGDLTNRATVEGTPSTPAGIPYGNVPNPTAVDTADVEIGASIGDTIWYDLNGNGIQDPEEIGVENVIVELYKDGVKLAEMTTDANGYYRFVDLGSGDYTVKVVPGAALEGYMQSYDLDGTLDHETRASLSSGEHIDNADFGYKPIPLCFIQKKADKSIVNVGDTITYTITIENRGKGILHNVWLRDPMLNIEQFFAQLASEETFTISESYVVKNADRPGPIVNVATVVSDETPEMEARVQVQIKVPSSGGGGGGYIPPEPPPIVPEQPKVPEQPQEPVKPPAGNTTQKETPKEGEVKIPENSTTEVGKPPESGTVTVGGDGRWRYTPNPDFVGKDKFTILINHPDGTEEVVIEIDVEDTKPPIEEVTTKETPKEGEVKVPENGTIEVGKPPGNGKVTIDENGKWKYIPNPDFIGKDKFTIIIMHSDGTEEEMFIEIDVGDIPLGVPDVLPKTGEDSKLGFYLIGSLLMLVGIFLRRKTV